MALVRPDESARRELRALLKKADLPDSHSHNLRHSAGILLLTKGCQELLGYRSSYMAIDRLCRTSLPAYKRLMTIN